MCLIVGVPLKAFDHRSHQSNDQPLAECCPISLVETLSRRVNQISIDDEGLHKTPMKILSLNSLSYEF